MEEIMMRKKCSKFYGFLFNNWITSVEGVEGLFKTSFFNFKIEAVEKAIS